MTTIGTESDAYTALETKAKQVMHDQLNPATVETVKQQSLDSAAAAHTLATNIVQTLRDYCQTEEMQRKFKRLSSEPPEDPAGVYEIQALRKAEEAVKNCSVQPAGGLSPLPLPTSRHWGVMDALLVASSLFFLRQ